MTIPLDLIRSTKGIAEALGCSARQARYLCETSQIPVFKIGSRWHARRATLERFLEDREKAALAAARAGSPPSGGDKTSPPDVGRSGAAS